MSEILRYAIIGLFFGTFGTTLGGVIGISFKKISSKFLSFILAVASGLMLSIVSFELVPEACDIAGTFTTIVGILLGICAMLFCDIFVNVKLQSRNVNQLLKTGIIVSIGLAIHNIPEGLAIGTGCENSIKLGMALAIAIAIHDIPEGMFQSRLYENNLKFA